MKKILVINNDHRVSQNALKFAFEIAVSENASLYGQFVASLEYKEVESYGFPSDINLTDTECRSYI